MTREIKKGTNLEFKVEGKLDTYHAQVYATESSIDMETHSLNIRAIYPNRNGELLAGRYADIQLKQKRNRRCDSDSIRSDCPRNG